MPDLLRVILFALSSGMLLASSLAIVSRLRLGRTASLQALWVVGSGQIVLLAQVLSLARALDWPGFLIGQAVILVGVVGLAPRPGRDIRCLLASVRAGVRQTAACARDWRRPAVPLATGAAVLVGLMSAILALWVPPNTADSLTYHLSRVGYYLQFRSLEHFQTLDLRQIIFPANAEVLILYTVAFLRSDRLAGTIQLGAWLFTIVSIYGLARQLRFSPAPALFGAAVFALLPASVLQSSSTQNDLLVTSFLLASLYLIVSTSRAERPTGGLLVAGAAAGLAIGTKLTAIVALPILAAAALYSYRRQPPSKILPGALLGSFAAALLGSYTYLQNWHYFGSLLGPPLVPTPLSSLRWEGFVPNLARGLYSFVLTDLSGPLADPRAAPLTAAVARGFAVIGEATFGLFSIPKFVDGLDIERTFTFVREANVNEDAAGFGLLGGPIIACAVATLLWPRRIVIERRLLAFVVVVLFVLISLAVPWERVGARFLMPVYALASPLLGALVQRPVVWRQGLAVLLAVVSAVSGLYTVLSNENKPVLLLSGQDRLGLQLLRKPADQAFFREVEQELGPRTVVGVYGTGDHGYFGWEKRDYLLFGERFDRTVLPLVLPSRQRSLRIKRQLPWSNETLLAMSPPDYLAIHAPGRGDERLPEQMQGRCYELPLPKGRPAGRWELQRCADADARNLLADSSLTGAGAATERTATLASPPNVEGAAAWTVLQGGGGGVTVRRLEPSANRQEPLRLELEYRATPNGSGGLFQTVPIGESLRGSRVVVDARVQASPKDAALLEVDDGFEQSGQPSRTEEPETLRVEHRLSPEARWLRIVLYVSNADRDATLKIRSILAIPRSGSAE